MFKSAVVLLTTLSLLWAGRRLTTNDCTSLPIGYIDGSCEVGWCLLGCKPGFYGNGSISCENPGNETCTRVNPLRCEGHFDGTCLVCPALHHCADGQPPQKCVLTSIELQNLPRMQSTGFKVLSGTKGIQCGSGSLEMQLSAQQDKTVQEDFSLELSESENWEIGGRVMLHASASAEAGIPLFAKGEVTAGIEIEVSGSGGKEKTVAHTNSKTIATTLGTGFSTTKTIHANTAGLMLVVSEEFVVAKSEVDVVLTYKCGTFPSQTETKKILYEAHSFSTFNVQSLSEDFTTKQDCVDSSNCVNVIDIAQSIRSYTATAAEFQACAQPTGSPATQPTQAPGSSPTQASGSSPTQDSGSSPTPACIVGSLGCPCTNGGSCDAGSCNGEICTCPIGSSGCECTSGGGCDSDLTCESSKCKPDVQPGASSGISSAFKSASGSALASVTVLGLVAMRLSLFANL